MALWDPIFDYRFESTDVAVFFTLILLEGVLSFDNAAVLAAMVRRLPREQQRKALLYGLVGAYAFRLLAILLATYLVRNLVLRVIGGVYLLYLASSHFARHARGHQVKEPKGFFGMSPFWSTVVMVEVADIVFALDQIVAAVALTDKILVIVLAAFFAILALRLSATYMIRVMNWFPAMEHLAYLAVGWVGVKLVIEDVSEYLAASRGIGHHIDFPKPVEVGVTMAILVLPVVTKLYLDWRRRRRGEPVVPRKPDVHPPV